MTQKITLKKIVSLWRKWGVPEHAAVMEVGGGNSCFAEDLCETVSVGSYSVIDNCEVAIERLKEKKFPVKGYCEDILKQTQDEKIKGRYDFVYSIGLVEHFRGSDIRKVIDRHFELCKDNGIVLISVPTPTRKYCFIRRCMELAGVWQFWDEGPLRWKDISRYVRRNGQVLEVFINHRLPLTQLIVVARKKE